MQNYGKADVDVSIMFTFQSSEGKPDDMSFGHYNEPFACKGVYSDPVNDVGREDGKKSDVTTYHVTGVLLHRNADPGCTFAIAAKSKQRVCSFISGTLMHIFPYSELCSLCNV